MLTERAEYTKEYVVQNFKQVFSSSACSVRELQALSHAGNWLELEDSWCKIVTTVLEAEPGWKVGRLPFHFRPTPGGESKDTNEVFEDHHAQSTDSGQQIDSLFFEDVMNHEWESEGIHIEGAGESGVASDLVSQTIQTVRQNKLQEMMEKLEWIA
ncbi:hypothetical protein M231_05300 [Tremella mesenterica]|uniref:Uncharacterized protein n=1 Tax=Tremella mesenterica TaxID=5217 RepID=A0A4Q1BIF1_TREME|nr:hypothetical protein M231_05300 [Tremella mesenterica]